MIVTPVSLLERLREPHDTEVWNRFVDLYTPLIWAWARQTGMQESDAADLVQDVFTLLLQKMPHFVYDRTGSFRAWLKTVTLNQWRANCRRAAIRVDGAGAAAGNGRRPAQEPIATNELEAFWDAEYHRHIVGQALRIMQADFEAKTWQACWEMVVNDELAAKVAQKLGITVGTVYAAKCRVLARLRQELAGLID